MGGTSFQRRATVEYVTCDPYGNQTTYALTVDHAPDAEERVVLTARDQHGVGEERIEVPRAAFAALAADFRLLDHYRIGRIDVPDADADLEERTRIVRASPEVASFLEAAAARERMLTEGDD